MKISNNKGFSLIELLIVMTIMAMLVMVGAKAWSTHIQGSKEKILQTEMVVFLGNVDFSNQEGNDNIFNTEDDGTFSINESGIKEIQKKYYLKKDMFTTLKDLNSKGIKLFYYQIDGEFDIERCLFFKTKISTSIAEKDGYNNDEYIEYCNYGKTNIDVTKGIEIKHDYLSE